METESVPLKRSILIADADKSVANQLAFRLGDQDRYVITTCLSSEAARQQLAGTPFDLFIGDGQALGPDATALIRDLQERSPQTVSIMIVPLGTDLQSQDVPPTQYHFVKPFDIQDLVNTIESIFPPQARPVSTNKRTVCKVVLGGDANVGKTSLIQRYCSGQFDPTRAMTIGIDFHVYDVQVERMPVRLVVWDLGGQNRFAITRGAFYRGSQAVGLVFDASNRISFYNLMRWLREVRSHLHDVPMLLLANKIDLPRQISHAEVSALAKAWGTPLFESSCATGAGVPEFFDSLAQHAWRHSLGK